MAHPVVLLATVPIAANAATFAVSPKNSLLSMVIPPSARFGACGEKEQALGEPVLRKQLAPIKRLAHELMKQGESVLVYDDLDRKIVSDRNRIRQMGIVCQEENCPVARIDASLCHSREGGYDRGMRRLDSGLTGQPSLYT